MFCKALFLGVALLAVGGAAAQDKKEDSKKAPTYIKVEVKGKLETGVVAIGGETTGIQIKAKGVTWEVDLGGNKEWLALAEKINGKTAIVAGELTERKGVERPSRIVLKATSFKAVEEK